MLVQDLVSASLRKLGVLAAGEAPSYDDSEDGRIALNGLVDQYAAERLEIPSILRTTWNLVSGTQNYTVGTGGTVNILRPMIITNVQYQDTALTPTLEYPLDVFTDDAWNGIAQKTITSPSPTAAYYNPTFTSGFGTLTFWPVPTSSTLQGVLYTPQALVEFASLSTTVTVPPAYRRMLTMALALELAPEYQIQPNPALVDAARDSLMVVKRSNVRLMDMSIDQGALIQGVSGRYMWDIRTGQ